MLVPSTPSQLGGAGRVGGAAGAVVPWQKAMRQPRYQRSPKDERPARPLMGSNRCSDSPHYGGWPEDDHTILAHHNRSPQCAVGCSTHTVSRQPSHPPFSSWHGQEWTHWSRTGCVPSRSTLFLPSTPPPKPRFAEPPSPSPLITDPLVSLLQAVVSLNRFKSLFGGDKVNPRVPMLYHDGCESFHLAHLAHTDKIGTRLRHEKSCGGE